MSSIIGHGIDMVLESRFERRRDKWSKTILSEKELEIYTLKSQLEKYTNPVKND